MPYWSSPRIGPQPTTSSTNKNGISNTKNNNKKQKKSIIIPPVTKDDIINISSLGRRGITMEDLKKQTALRLAQPSNNNDDDDVAVVSNDQYISIATTNNTAVNTTTHNKKNKKKNAADHISTTPSSSSSSGRMLVEHEGKPAVAVSAAMMMVGTADMATSSLPTTTSLPPPPAVPSNHRLFRTSSSSMTINKSPNKKYMTTPTKLPAVTATPTTTCNNNSGSGFFPFSRNTSSSSTTTQPQPSSVSRINLHSRKTTTSTSSTPIKQQPAPAAPRSLFFTSSMGRNDHTHHHCTDIDTSTATEKGSNAKLPHGLTVSELKQMTKARLQAEHHHHHHQQHVASTTTTTTSANATGTPSTLMCMDGYSIDSQQQLYVGSSLTTTTTAPSPIPRRSPYPSQMILYNDNTTSETWETASVSTTCTSELFFPIPTTMTTNIQPDESLIAGATTTDVSNNIPFIRSMSYPLNNDNQHHHQPSSLPFTMVNNNYSIGNHHGTPQLYHYSNNSEWNASSVCHFNHSNNIGGGGGMASTGKMGNRCRAATSSPRLGASSTCSGAAFHPRQVVYNNIIHDHYNYPTDVNKNNNSSVDVVIDDTLSFPNEYNMSSHTMFEDRDVLLHTYNNNNMNRSMSMTVNNSDTTNSGNYYYSPDFGTSINANNHHHNVPMTHESNRIRTSSLPTVLIPHTTVVEGDSLTNFVGSSTSHFNTRRHGYCPMENLAAVNESPTPKVVVAGLSDTFQSPSIPSYPPSLYSFDNDDDTFALDDPFGMTNINRNNDDLPPIRYRAATWANASTTTNHISINNNSTATEASSLLLFGNVGCTAAHTNNNSSATADLSDDLASILKLSTTTSSLSFERAN